MLQLVNHNYRSLQRQYLTADNLGINTARKPKVKNWSGNFHRRV